MCGCGKTKAIYKCRTKALCAYTSVGITGKRYVPFPIVHTQNKPHTNPLVEFKCDVPISRDFNQGRKLICFHANSQFPVLSASVAKSNIFILVVGQYFSLWIFAPHLVLC